MMRDNIKEEEAEMVLEEAKEIRAEQVRRREEWREALVEAIKDVRYMLKEYQDSWLVKIGRQYLGAARRQYPGHGVGFTHVRRPGRFQEARVRGVQGFLQLSQEDTKHPTQKEA